MTAEIGWIYAPKVSSFRIYDFKCTDSETLVHLIRKLIRAQIKKLLLIWSKHQFKIRTVFCRKKFVHFPELIPKFLNSSSKKKKTIQKYILKIIRIRSWCQSHGQKMKSIFFSLSQQKCIKQNPKIESLTRIHLNRNNENHSKWSVQLWIALRKFVYSWFNKFAQAR